MKLSIIHNWHALTECTPSLPEQERGKTGEKGGIVLIRSALQTVPVLHLGSVALSLTLIMH